MDRRERLERLKRKQTRILNRMVATFFVVFVVLLSVASLLKPDVEFSEEENRILAKAPKISLQELKSGDFMEGAEDYATDQFLLRNFWIRVKVRADLLLGKREFNGVYLGSDKYLIQALSEPDKKNVKENLKAIDTFAKDNEALNVHMMIVPNAAYILQNRLPLGAPTRDQSADLKWIREQLGEEVGFIDVTRALKQHAKESIYYKTDHHWTSLGAKIGFEAAAENLGIMDPVTAYDVYTVSTDFSGTLASVSGYHGAEDVIEVYAPKNMEIEYLVTNSDSNEKLPTIYDKSALDRKDQYQVFFGGNYALTDIVTANDVDQRLLIFKDSYANCFIQFLLPYYNEIVMVDPRYYYENVQTLIDNKRITDVLFLYNMDTFMTDRSLADVLVTE